MSPVIAATYFNHIGFLLVRNARVSFWIPFHSDRSGAIHDGVRPGKRLLLHRALHPTNGRFVLILRERVRDHRGIRESAQSLEITVTDGPNVSERHIERDCSLSGLSFDSAQCNDLIARGDELLCNKTNIERLIKTCEKAFEHILKPFEMAAANRHTQRQIVNDVRGLQASQRFSMSWNGRFVKCADAVLIVCFTHCFLLLSRSSHCEQVILLCKTIMFSRLRLEVQSRQFLSW